VGASQLPYLDNCMRLYLDPEKLARVAAEHRESYTRARPFPHAVLDNVLPEDALELALDAFPTAGSNVWQEYGNYYEAKLAARGEERLGDDISLLLYQFNSAPFLRFLEDLTGIKGLLPDPYFTGGGLHQIVRGGKLGIHADFSRHGQLPLHRRLNVLIYLNRDWKEEYGGDLELWDANVTQCCTKIAPLFNRMVIFTVTDWSFHGHPEPLACPEGMTRKSIALYYFTADRPTGETLEGKNSTLFVSRPGEVAPRHVKGSREGRDTGLKEDRFLAAPARTRVKRLAVRLTPPILLDAVRAVRTRR
jgi:hypothetical protein